MHIACAKHSTDVNTLGLTKVMGIFCVWTKKGLEVSRVSRTDRAIKTLSRLAFLRRSRVS